MPIYDRPTKALMSDWVKLSIVPGQTFDKSVPIRWFQEHYPKIKSSTVGMHIESMSVNNPLRRHFPAVHAGSGHDLFFKIGPNQFRLWDPDRDPAPRYKRDFDSALEGLGNVDINADEVGTTESEVSVDNSTTFALERDLRNYLERNLHRIEPGLEVYEEEGIRGVEFPVGGRFIDILAHDKNGGYVVIELKVSRGYDRAIGQLLRYMGWVTQNMEPSHPVRGIIVANEISTDLRLAAANISNVQLIEYEMSFNLRAVTHITSAKKPN